MGESPGEVARSLLRRAEGLHADVTLGEVRAWKAAHPGRPAIGCMPVYVPREIIHAAGGLAVSLHGGGDQVEIVRGDACFQSYICHLPRSTVELGLSGDLDLLDGVVFPSTCDVIRNLSGIWQLRFPGKLARYLDLPQAFTPATGGRFYQRDLRLLADQIEAVGGLPYSPDRLRVSIAAYNENRRALASLHDLRAQAPWQVPADECYLVSRAGSLLPVEDHTALIDAYVLEARGRARRVEDRIRVVLVGAFCEQPPLALLRTVERAGCYVVEDDLNLGARWLRGDVRVEEDPLDALAGAYLDQSAWASTRYEHDRPRGLQLVEQVRARSADGVVFAAPSFCDPALLDQPPLQRALEEARIPFVSFKYSESTGQFQSVREQVGAFSDAIRLWGEP